MRRTAPHRRGRRTLSPPANPAVQAAILEIVENQLRDNDPPEVRRTLARLIASGSSDEKARLLIGMVVLFEMNDMLKTNTAFDHDRYVSALDRLPNLS